MASAATGGEGGDGDDGNGLRSGPRAPTTFGMGAGGACGRSVGGSGGGQGEEARGEGEKKTNVFLYNGWYWWVINPKLYV